jgi:outer membrane protein TolC
LIQKERAVRELSLTEDQIRLAVRSAYRDLEQAKTNYDIASQAVNLNQRRVEEQELLASLGRATALNQVDALNDLTRSQNDLTAALINHTLARLSLWRDMGILYVKKDGRWEEIQDERGPTTLHDIVHAP